MVSYINKKEIISCSFNVKRVKTCFDKRNKFCFWTKREAVPDVC